MVSNKIKSQRAEAGILESLRADVLGGILTIQEAAAELHTAGWMNYIDVENAKRLLKLEKE